MSSEQVAWRSVIMAAASGAAILSAGVPAHAARINFDGPWSVTVITDYGACDRAYRYGLEIQNGQVFYRGSSGVDISGRVTPRGQVSVQLRQGESQAVGSGRLSEASGGGRWRGASTGQQCGGHWVAERR